MVLFKNSKPNSKTSFFTNLKSLFFTPIMSSRKSSMSSSRKSTNTAKRRYRPAVQGRGAYRPYRRYVRGRGAYYVQGGVYGRAQLGSLKFGGAANAGVTNLQDFRHVPSIQGMGAYNVSSIRHNVLLKPDIPEMRNSVYVEGGTIIRHREYLGAITTAPVAGQFRIQTYPLNPAQALTFPWLSTIAQNYEEYKPNGLSFEFRSTASDAIASSTNLALGQIMMCTQYDPTDPIFSDDVSLLNYTWAQSGKVSDTVQHFVECDPKQSPLSHLYTRSDAPANDTDLRFSDFGTFSIASSGLQGTNVQIGQLWVTYEFIMYKPKINNDLPGSAGYWHYGQHDGSVTAANCVGTIATGILDPANNLLMTLTDPASYSQLNFPDIGYDATYQVQVCWDGDSTASVSVPLTTHTNCVKVKNFADPAVSQISYPTAASTVARAGFTVWASVMRGAGSDASIQFSMTTIPANSSVDVYVTQIPWLNPNIYGYD